MYSKAVKRCNHVQVGKAASKGGSVADKAGSAVKDIKGKNPFGELHLPNQDAATVVPHQKPGIPFCAACVRSTCF